ncbi:hypothetical protein MUN81_00920 [Hymenobacter sp. 5317J-9]|uniref:hypothetical protein n=1 Tax=Hymenobacter sp. 5317J-9 TaxID=2932250 RepID=UPI001FD63416|nr:hypothetical protein [Hymenobacter sp. 5317J-9]UOQ98068.1 hypothetical protein MUN81_00920 [Hymenobacter sp. 5317J-9]
MDNQPNQPGSPMAGDDVRNQNAGTPTGSTGLGNDAATGSSRKAASGRSTSSAQNTSASADASSQTSANAGADRQGEGQQTNGDQANLLDTAMESGKKWIQDSGVLDSVNQLPQGVKDWGSRALSRVGELSTTQKVVGGAILAAGLGWLALRKGGKPSDSTSRSDYGRQSSGSYGRRSYGYQAPDASTSRRTASGASSRQDSGSPYGNSGSRYGGSGSSYDNSRNSSYGSNSGSSHNSGSSYSSSSTNADRGHSSNSGILGGSGRSDSGSGFGSSSSGSGDSGARTSENSYRKNDDFRSIE